jgi:hypothetical protein
MRLLQRNDNGEFNLTRDFVGDDVTPPYAILSHTWGADTEEVTFEDITWGTGKAKQGLQKLQFCEEQARKNGLQYFWVDTCCIDKTSSAELTQAINSMFRWYRHAARCYVYLSDVSSRLNYDGSMTVPNHLAFQESRWFKRGWTLQELLAPSSVEFFSGEGKKLGDKRSLGPQISAITSIPDAALQGASLSQFSIDERLSWINHRQTKLGEDKAYSLLGIFDVYIPLIYGEGQDHAFVRLRKAIEESPKNGSHALPLALSTPQPKQRRNGDTVTQKHKSGVICYKCTQFLVFYGE